MKACTLMATAVLAFAPLAATAQPWAGPPPGRGFGLGAFRMRGRFAPRANAWMGREIGRAHV